MFILRCSKPLAEVLKCMPPTEVISFLHAIPPRDREIRIAHDAGYRFMQLTDSAIRASLKECVLNAEVYLNIPHRVTRRHVSPNKPRYIHVTAIVNEDEMSRYKSASRAMSPRQIFASVPVTPTFGTGSTPLSVALPPGLAARYQALSEATNIPIGAYLRTRLNELPPAVTPAVFDGPRIDVAVPRFHALALGVLAEIYGGDPVSMLAKALPEARPVPISLDSLDTVIAAPAVDGDPLAQARAICGAIETIAGAWGESFRGGLNGVDAVQALAYRTGNAGNLAAQAIRTLASGSAGSRAWRYV